jgi:hypothetical protein
MQQSMVPAQISTHVGQYSAELPPSVNVHLYRASKDNEYQLASMS